MGSNKMKADRLKLKAAFRWMTCCLGSCLLILAAVCAHAQTFAEWFSQKKTKLKYLTQQIAALEQYGFEVKQGYQIMHGGWGSIGNWAKGEYDLHSAYYSSLKTVNPEIGNNPEADSVVSYAQLIPQQFNHLDGWSSLDKGTRAYIGRVRAAVLRKTDQDLAELQLVMTGGKVELTDDGRIARLDRICERIRDRLVFCRSFCNGVRLLLLRRNQDLQDMQTLRRYYEIN